MTLKACRSQFGCLSQKTKGYAFSWLEMDLDPDAFDPVCSSNCSLVKTDTDPEGGSGAGVGGEGMMVVCVCVFVAGGCSVKPLNSQLSKQSKRG